MGFTCPAFADVFVRREAAERLEAATVVICVDEVVEVRSQLGMAVVVVAFDRSFLDGAVHPFDLAIGPGVLHLGQAMLDAVLVADAVEDMMEGVFVADLVNWMPLSVSTVWMA